MRLTSFANLVFKYYPLQGSRLEKRYSVQRWSRGKADNFILGGLVLLDPSERRIASSARDFCDSDRRCVGSLGIGGNRRQGCVEGCRVGLRARYGDKWRRVLYVRVGPRRNVLLDGGGDRLPSVQGG